MRHPRYKKLFPRTLISPTKDSEKEFETTKLGFRFSTSVGGTLTGRGASLIIVDDPMSTNDADSETFLARTETWCRETLLSRLDNKKDDAIILIMQRLHPEDLAGVALKMGGWKHLNLPAIAEQTHDVILDSHHFYRRTPGHVLFPERESKETLEKIKREMGTRAFAAQYQQSPVPADGNLIKVSWLQRYRAPLEINFDDKIMISCDTAQSGKDIMGASYSVIMRCVIRGDDVYINDVIRGRWEYPELKRRVREQYYRFHREASGFELVIENKGIGLSLIQDLKEEHIRAMPMEPDGDKVVRASKHTARIERGCLHLPDEAPWLGDFIDELRAFPSGRYDDQVDALSQVFERAFYPIRRGRAGTSGARGTI